MRLRETYAKIALTHEAIDPKTIAKIKRLSESTLVAMLSLRHPLEDPSKLSKSQMLEKFKEERWFPHDSEI